MAHLPALRTATGRARDGRFHGDGLQLGAGRGGWRVERAACGFDLVSHSPTSPTRMMCSLGRVPYPTPPRPDQPRAPLPAPIARSNSHSEAIGSPRDAPTMSCRNDWEGLLVRQIAVDVGGTFTDVFLLDDGGGLIVHKVPSTPQDPSIATIEEYRPGPARGGLTSVGSRPGLSRYDGGDQHRVAALGGPDRFVDDGGLSG